MVWSRYKKCKKGKRVLLYEERKKIAAYGKKMLRDGLVKGTGGNISIYNRQEGLVAISPSSVNYLEVEPEDVAVTDLEGNLVEGGYKPSSEFRMHAVFYKKRDDVSAVVHTHSANAAALSCMRRELPIIYYLQVMAGDSPIRCAPYAVSGSAALAEAAYEAMGPHNAALLANHGVIVAAADLDLAYYTAEQVEFAAGLYLKAGADESRVVPLTGEECREMKEVFKKVFYGSNG